MRPKVSGVCGVGLVGGTCTKWTIFKGRYRYKQRQIDVQICSGMYSVNGSIKDKDIKYRYIIRIMRQFKYVVCGPLW